MHALDEHTDTLSYRFKHADLHMCSTRTHIHTHTHTTDTGSNGSLRKMREAEKDVMFLKQIHMA